MTGRVALLVALAAAVSPAPPAGAATVTLAGATVTIAAPARERNDVVVVGLSGGGVGVRDDRSPLTAGPGCMQTAPNGVRCSDAAVEELVADLGSRNDEIALGSSAPVRGTLRGGSGNDTLRGGPRADRIEGGSGRDTVTYSGRADDVTLTLMDGADDGGPGEGDEVMEVERAIGGNGFDTILGTEGGNALFGGPGDDRLDGAGGVDSLAGGRGNDLLQGGAGEDTFVAERTPDGSDALQGGDGADRADYARRTGDVVVDADGRDDDGERPGGTLVFVEPLPPIFRIASPERDNVLPDVESVRGGAGADVLAPAGSGGRAEGGPGTDVVYGGPGADDLAGDGGFDRIVARGGGRDTVHCGSEVDRAWVDLGDPVDFDCEQRATSFAPRVAPVGRRIEAEGLRVRVECPAQASMRCAGTLRATTVRRVDGRRVARLGLRGYALASGTSQEVVIPFDEAARSIVGRFAPLRVRVAIRGRDEAGAARPSASRLILRR